MRNKLCIIASWLFVCAFAVVLPVPAFASAKPVTLFTKGMSFGVNFGKAGLFMLSKELTVFGSQKVTDAILNRLFKKELVGSRGSVYAKKGLGITSNIVTRAGVDFALMPLFFSRKRHPFQFWLALVAAQALTAAVTQRIGNYCLSKVSHKSTNRYLLSLGLAVPVMVGLEYLKVKTPYALTRSCTGIGELPILPIGLTLAKVLYEPLMFVCIFLENITTMQNASVK